MFSIPRLIVLVLPCTLFVKHCTIYLKSLCRDSSLCDGKSDATAREVRMKYA